MSTAPATAAARPDDAIQAPGGVRNPVLVIAVLAFSSLCASLMQSLVIPIQSSLPRYLDTTPANASWVVTATLLGAGVAMPVAGRLADILGKKKVLVISGAILIIGSVLCALTSSFLVVVAGRVLQGLAMGYIPVAISMVHEVAPRHMVNTAVATISATLGVGGALGLPLAAWVAQYADWHALFWLAGALALILTVLTVVVLPSPPGRGGRLDYVGAVGLGIGLVCVLVGVSKGNEWGWGSGITWGLVGGGIVVLAVWSPWELRHDAPLVNLRTFGRLPILLTNLAALMAGIGLMSQSIVVPQLLQMPAATGYGLEQSILAAGLWMAPGGLMMMAFSPVSSRLLTSIGGRLTLAIGMFVVAAGYVFAALMTDAPWKLMVATCISSAGVGIAYAAMPSIIMEHAPRAESGSSVGVNALMRSVGTTVAGALMAIVLTSSTIQLAPGVPPIPTHSAFQWCFYIGAAAALAATVLALAVPKAKEPHHTLS
ncbi:MFS transporter [Corynebacterium sp. 335C]